jgi:hypothetical protein
VEAVFLICGAGGPQLKRNPLGSTPLPSVGVTMRKTLPLLTLLAAGFPTQALRSQAPPLPSVDVRQIMTASQFQAAGLGKLSETELASLNKWLGELVVKLVTARDATNTPAVIESQIDGEFEGWDGDTIFKLVNGQIWQQSSYHYHYHYAYMPRVTIYRSGTGYKMKVEGVDQTISVQRLR